MFFSTKLVRYYLVKVPCQDEVDYNVNYKTYHRVYQDVVIDRICKINFNLNSLSIDNSLKSQHKSCMRYNTNSPINLNSRVIRINRNKRQDILHHKEKQSYHHTYLGSSQKHLDEEILNDQNYIEKNEYDERDEERDIGKCDWKNYRTDDVDDQIYYEVSEEPS